ncbi:conserved hypothetical protein [Culex quinquefasciatus]|uniref:Uncharacterized protein n=1 Tax=Culex quinquefasciatus TaxID=7176 RepID=B0X0Z8_CULQU|nr:conserved hypothetical protein [Culex quinquefasciatus]|eukprot:XP_001863320.1 conserved hypothetical protein [Culex quinquefasciatus]
MDTSEEVLCFEESASSISNGGGGGGGGVGDNEEANDAEAAAHGEEAADGDEQPMEKEGEANSLQESSVSVKGQDPADDEDVIVLDSDDEDQKPVLAELEAKLKKDKVAVVKKTAAEVAEPDDAVPEDMADMTVVDEADCSDADSDLDENGESRQWDCPLAKKAPRTYREKDFRPTEKDPRCKDDWTLAAFWPVYVSNFRLFNKFDSDTSCIHAVHKYFAAKGLPSFMVFRWKDSFFNDYQKRVGVYDFLVYFCTEKDANRAIQWCNRESYYGHKLNVYSGRTPDLFSKQKSWRLKHLKAEDKLETESNLEQYLRRYGEVRCVSKQDLDGVLVEFDKTFEDFESLFAEDRRIEASPIEGPVSRQRFVEQDVEEEILKWIEGKPKVVKTRPRNFLLRSLKHGVIPEMWNLWLKTEAEALAEFKNKRREGPPGRAADRKQQVSRRGNPVRNRTGQGGAKQAPRSQNYRSNQAGGGGGAGAKNLREPLPPRPPRRDRSPYRGSSPPRRRPERSRSGHRSGPTRPLDDIDKIIKLKQELANLYARQLDGVSSPGPRHGPRDGAGGSGNIRNRPQPYHWNKQRDDLLLEVGGRRDDSSFRRNPVGGPPPNRPPYNNNTGNNRNPGPGAGAGPNGNGQAFPKRNRIRGRKKPRGAGAVGGAAAPRANP